MPKAEPVDKTEEAAIALAAKVETVTRIGKQADIEQLLVEIKSILLLCLAELRRLT